VVGRVVIIALISIVMVLLDYFKSRDLKKTLIASGLFIYVFTLFFVGMITREILPLFVIHIVLIIVAWGSVAWYLIRGKIYPLIYILPLLNIALVFVLNFLEGSRYES